MDGDLLVFSGMSGDVGLNNVLCRGSLRLSFFFFVKVNFSSTLGSGGTSCKWVEQKARLGIKVLIPYRFHVVLTDHIGHERAIPSSR